MHSNLQEFIHFYQQHVNQLLKGHLTKYGHHSHRQLAEAMKYGLLMGGKRIRPLLVYASAQAVSQVSPATDTLACAIEAIHAYSLIHDDLPAMDNDDLRRGQPTCHIAFDEATAILAGDALQTMAFELVSSISTMPPSAALKALGVLAQASGARGMVLGQAIDLHSVDRQVPLAELEDMHNHKTGALIEAAVKLGALSANANETHTKSLCQYARAIGLAFQVQDDILDVISDTETLGKTQGADAELNKPTYVSLLGLKGAQGKAKELIEMAHKALSDFGNSAKTLHDLADYTIERNH